MNNKENKFLKYLKLILESSEMEDDEEIEKYQKTGKIPEGTDPRDFLYKHGDMLMDQETKLKYEKINKFLTKAGSKSLLNFTPKTIKELHDYDINKNIQFHGQDKINFIDAVVTVVLNLDNDNRSFFLTTLLTHSPDYIKIANEIYDFATYNHKDQPHFCEKLEILFHAKPEYESTTFKTGKFDIEKEKENKDFIGGLKYFANDPLIKSNETIKAIVDSLIKNLHIKINFDDEAHDLNSTMIDIGEILDTLEERFDEIKMKSSFNKQRIFRFIEKPKLMNDADKKMFENFIGQIAIIDEYSGDDAYEIELYMQISGGIPKVDRNEIIEKAQQYIQKIARDNADETDPEEINKIKIDIKNIKNVISYIKKNNLNNNEREIIKNLLESIKNKMNLNTTERNMIDSYMRRIGIIFDHVKNSPSTSKTIGVKRPGEIRGWSKYGHRY